MVAPVDGAEQALLEPPSEPLTGDSHAHLIEPMVTSRVPQLAAQRVGALGAGLELVGDVAAERFGEALLKRAQLLAQPVIVRLGVGQIGAATRR
jgi:hypothetical protein